MKREFLAYRGVRLTIEWYFDERGKSLANEYFEDLSFDKKKKIFYLFRLLGDVEGVFPRDKFRYEGDKIYAIKSSQDRFLCFFFGEAKIIITNAYEKKSEKMPLEEKAKALRARDSYLKRYKEGVYYE